jgi:glycosyltransferase involved in cell wall biosynthesis
MMADTTPIKVLFIKDHLNDAGGTAYFLRVLPRLDRARVEPVLCTLRARHPVGLRFEAAGIRPTFLSRAKWDPRAVSDLRRVIREQKPEIIHIEGRKSLLMGRVAARLAGRPVIAHFHDMLPVAGWLDGLQRSLAPWTTVSLAVSQAVRQWAIRNFAIPPGRIEVLYNGLDLERFTAPAADARARIRGELGLDPTTPLVGLVGRIVTAIKGHDLMIRALPELLSQCPGAVLAIIGDGPDRQACQALAAELGVGAAVRFTGQRNDIPDLLAALDVVVMTSLSEGLPYAAIEAAAAGRPVVAFANGGIPEVVLDGETGILVASGDVAGLARALARVLNDPALMRGLGQAGRRHAQRFAISEHVRKLEDVYERIAGRAEGACSATPLSALALAPAERSSAGDAGGR